MDAELQELRIVPDWKVLWNTFMNVDPSIETIHNLSGSSLLCMRSEHRNRYIDLSFVPEDDPNGSFKLLVLNSVEIFNSNKNEFEYESDWDDPYLEFYSKSRIEIVNKLNQLFISLPKFEDERFLLKRGEIDFEAEKIRLEILEFGLSDDIIKRSLKIKSKELTNYIIDYSEISEPQLKLILESKPPKAIINKIKQRTNSIIKKRR